VRLSLEEHGTGRGDGRVGSGGGFVSAEGCGRDVVVELGDAARFG